ncbi:hypothetical protein POLEWNIK_00270 [Brevundimonas phage vB_BpoS-Polewnik]|nr:hypothetical protein POLEWNIK_00270 [Brevundimonas phage vB_BpoS-Polewnik]
MQSSVTVGDRVYTMDSIRELMTVANTAGEEAQRAAATFEIASLSLFSQLLQTETLVKIAQQLEPVVTSVSLDIEAPGASEEDHPAGKTREQMLKEAAHDHPILQTLRSRVVVMGKPAIMQTVKQGVLKVFYEGAADPVWKYTQDGHPISEDKMIALLDAANPPSDT